RRGRARPDVRYLDGAVRRHRRVGARHRHRRRAGRVHQLHESADLRRDRRAGARTGQAGADRQPGDHVVGATRPRAQSRWRWPAAAGEVRMTDQPSMTAEYAGRLQRVREAMSQKGFAALVVCDPANIFYLTGYNAWSFYTPQCLLVGADGAPHLFTRAMDAAGAGFTADLDEDHIHGYPEE